MLRGTPPKNDGFKTESGYPGVHPLSDFREKTLPLSRPARNSGRALAREGKKMRGILLKKKK